jgi:hypothetical protein
MKRRSHISLSLALISSLVVTSTDAMHFKENSRNKLSVSTNDKKSRRGTGNLIPRAGFDSPTKNRAELFAHIRSEVELHYKYDEYNKQETIKQEVRKGYEEYCKQLREYSNRIRAENS